MKVVSAYRPFPPESPEHQALGAFDWLAALRMLATSARLSCGIDVFAITDVDTDLGLFPSYRYGGYAMTERRLMLWILGVSLEYLRSDDFDQDTVFVSPDCLVVGDLRPYFKGDLTVLVRPHPKHRARPILNAVQWWPVLSKRRLIAFYEQALDVARQLPETLKIWGADSEAIRALIEPIGVGRARRAGLKVNMVEASSVMTSITEDMIAELDAGRPIATWTPIVDFKYSRKRYMAKCFDALFGAAA